MLEDCESSMRYYWYSHGSLANSLCIGSWQRRKSWAKRRSREEMIRAGKMARSEAA